MINADIKVANVCHTSIFRFCAGGIIVLLCERANVRLFRKL